MFIFKNSYYLYIENTKILNLNLIKIRDKFTIIYRNNNKQEDIGQLKAFRKECRRKSIKFFVVNDLNLLKKLKADGLYISSYNKSLSVLKYKKFIFKTIGSAHNFNEINIKINQGCDEIILSRLFKTDYKNKKSFLGVIKFNLISSFYKKNLIPLGGIRLNNLGKIKLVKSKSFGIMSEIKKKPAIFSRLF
tara:strand:+ start:221 stop:793 length:573 start_codon:yes stop_codon:yes gene_type:complete